MASGPRTTGGGTSADPSNRPSADQILRRLGFHQSPGPGPGSTDDLGWLRGPEPWWDLRDSQPLRGLLENEGLPPSALQGLHYRRVCFGDRERDRDPANLAYARFKGSRFDNVAFVNAQLTGVYLRECDFYACDFRYTYLTSTTFQNSKLRDCDFYRAYFEAANVFTDTTFERVSLDKAWLAGMIGLTGAPFVENALVQECTEREYRRFLDETIGDRPDSHTLAQALEEALLDAAEIYRGLSGMYTSQGQFKDAGAAYVHCKTLERRYHSPLRALLNRGSRKREQHASAIDRVRPRRTRKWLALTAAWAVANFGESMSRVFAWLVAVVLGPAILLSLFGGVRLDDSHRPVHSLARCLLFSFEQLTASVQRMHGANSVVDLVGALQVFVGVTLLGLLGFTLANRLRNQ